MPMRPPSCRGSKMLPTATQPGEGATAEPFGAIIRDFINEVLLPGAYAQSTKDNWARELRQMQDRQALGAVPADTIEPHVIDAYFAGLRKAEAYGKAKQA